MARRIIKTVIFDMDGVITHTMPYHFMAWRHVLSKNGIHVSHADIYTREGQRGIMSIHEIAKEYGKVLSEAKMKALLKEKENYFKEIMKERYIPGARRFIRELHRKKIPLAIVTGTSRHEFYKILPRYLIEMFSVIITGTDVRLGKPHPEPYRKALKMLGVKPQEAVVIENAPFGITSAKKAGAYVFAVETSLKRLFLKEADDICGDFKELKRKIRKLV